MPEKIVTVIQARMSSTRLPGKVMLPVAGRPLLVRMVERVQMARTVGTVVVATSTDSADDPIAALCEEIGFHCFRGHPTDLLDRHYRTGVAYSADAVVKIPSDCPLIDPTVIDRVIGTYLADPTSAEFVSNLHPATYPDGNDVEVMTMPALATAWREAEREFEREHTTPFFWEQPERFRQLNVFWETGLDYSKSHRWTIDYDADYRFISAVYHALYPTNPCFGLTDILRLLERQPELMTLNQQYAGEYWYRHHLDELATISAEAAPAAI